MVTPVDAWRMKIEKKIEYLVECRTHERVTKKKKTYLKTVKKNVSLKHLSHTAWDESFRLKMR